MSRSLFLFFFSPQEGETLLSHDSVPLNVILYTCLVVPDSMGRNGTPRARTLLSGVAL